MFRRGPHPCQQELDPYLKLSGSVSASGDMNQGNRFAEEKLDIKKIDTT